MEQKPAAIRLFGYSFLILFFELALIRFVPAHVRLAAYFINLVLIAAFLGMGTGLILQLRKRDLTFLFPPALLVLILACYYLSSAIVEQTTMGSEPFYTSHFDLSPTARKLGMIPVVSLLFILTTPVFIPLGYAAGREFEKFPPLIAYTINILGSVAGLAGFALLSKYATPPLVWFTLGAVCFLGLSPGARGRIVSLVCFAVILFMTQKMQLEGKEVWSPYYKIDYISESGETGTYTINVNSALHQYMLDLSPANVARNKITGLIQADYLRPYKLAKSFDDVLVMGAGTGNDVSLLLGQNPRHIDAVEIDPEIYKIGKRLNRLKPYDDPRVSIHIDDARAFLKKTGHRYDVIVLGTLDSLTLLSGMSSIRLDNYVYTVESFRAMKEHLKPDGILIMYHMSQVEYIPQKVYAALTEVFGRPPLMSLLKPHWLFNVIFVAGSQAPVSREFPYQYQIPEASKWNLQVATDDWPYLFLPRAGIPEHYLAIGGVIALFSIVLVGSALGRKNLGAPDSALFFLGAGFLLLETKSVTEMSLLFGSTWQVNVLVFLSILVLVLAANLLVLKSSGAGDDPLFYTLFGLMAFSYFIPVDIMLGLPLLHQWLAGGLLVALPLFFAGMIFARVFKNRTQPVKSLGYNLIGAILGGLLEYSSMLLGTKSLYLLALIMYFLAYTCLKREKPELAANARK